MADTALLLGIFLGAIVIVFLITTPFVAIWNQNKRNALFRKIAEKYGLQYVQNYPNNTFIFQTLFSNPPKAARSLEGTIHTTAVILGDYIPSVYWWSNIVRYITSGMVTKFYLNGKEQIILLPWYWGLASEKQIESLLASVQ